MCLSATSLQLNQVNSRQTGVVWKHVFWYTFIRGAPQVKRHQLVPTVRAFVRVIGLKFILTSSPLIL